MSASSPRLLTVSYTYDARVVSVHDGDTITLDVDLGFYVRVRQACRLLGINAAELGTDKGNAARELVTRLLTPGTPVTVQSVRADKYGGRFLGDVMLLDGRRPADLLVIAGLAAVWDGKGPRPQP